MEKINSLLPKQEGLATGLTNSQEKPSTVEKLSDVWVLALFKKFQARYLHKWTSAIDGIEESAMQEWGRVLRGLSGEEIKHGLDSWKDPWPPCADEFRDCCLGTVKNGFGLNHTPQYYHKQPETDQAKLANPATEETRKQALADCKAMLGMREQG